MVLGAMGKQITCYECGQPGHIRRNCPKFKNKCAAPRQQLNNVDIEQQVHNILNMGMKAALNQ